MNTQKYDTYKTAPTAVDRHKAVNDAAEVWAKISLAHLMSKRVHESHHDQQRRAAEQAPSARMEIQPCGVRKRLGACTHMHRLHCHQQVPCARVILELEVQDLRRRRTKLTPRQAGTSVPEHTEHCARQSSRAQSRHSTRYRHSQGPSEVDSRNYRYEIHSAR